MRLSDHGVVQQGICQLMTQNFSAAKIIGERHKANDHETAPAVESGPPSGHAPCTLK